MALLGRWSCLAAALLLLGPAAPAGAAREYTVKAAFLLNFARLVEWPGDALPAEPNPWVLCVYGQDPFGGALEDTFRGKQVQERAVSIARPDSADGLDACHMVFVPAQRSGDGASVLARTARRSVLVVGESEGFAADGAAINLFEESGKVRFEINLDAARSARLKVSSRLLRLARLVESTS